jgi:hypothetical protein
MIEQKEIWKEIPSFPGYECNMFGEIRTTERTKHFYRGKKEKLPIVKMNTKFFGAILWRNGKKKRVCIHKLIAETWLPNPLKYKFVMHLDGDHFNNSVFNLEWKKTANNNPIRNRNKSNKHKKTGDGSSCNKCKYCDTRTSKKRLNDSGYCPSCVDAIERIAALPKRKLLLKNKYQSLTMEGVFSV